MSRSPALITTAAPSADEQLARRRRKYVVMMACRIPCLVLAGLTAHVGWLALAFLAISVPLPWAAVLIANDVPARRTERISRFRPRPRPGLPRSAAERRQGLGE
ncbi:DUF3099 domain-containing protein [Amycolatopsis sp. CA-126428]|uniref:DUF3099 domain-containing protein n=1 Tax=Amycolatopsis sp. CA-126428 TaxID=2073158 RepID=UPI000CD06DE2|nr:DUF3099 domain-containing protein [Amycolatopsis sp. CA-126428]